MDFLKYELGNLSEELKNKKELFNNSSKNLSKLISNLKNIFSDNENYKELISGITKENWENVKSRIESDLRNEKEAREVDSYLIQEYKHFPIQHIQNELSEYIALRNKLAASSTEERLKTVQVVACTLDGYIG